MRSLSLALARHYEHGLSHDNSLSGLTNRSFGARCNAKAASATLVCGLSYLSPGQIRSGSSGSTTRPVSSGKLSTNTTIVTQAKKTTKETP